jgi:adenylate cyclase
LPAGRDAVREVLKSLGASDEEIDDASDSGAGALITLGANKLIASATKEKEAQTEAPPESSGDQIVALLHSVGASDEEIEHAQADGSSGLLALAADRLFVPGNERLTRIEVAERSGIPVEEAATYWRALGFADVSDDDRIFTEQDVEMLRLLKNLLATGFADRELALQMTRVLGRSMQNVAAAQVDVVRRIASQLPVEAARDEAMMALVQSRQAFLEVIERALVYTWRRHLAAEVKRTAITLEEGTQGHTVVGFADLVGFTALSAQMDEATLATAVSSFEATAVEVVAGLGGRVVKMIGDEVMFESLTAADGVEMALQLVEAFAEDEKLPDVRAGLAEGMATPYQGDLFGPGPNLAHRLVDVALPASVLVSNSVHEAAEGDPRFEFHPVRPQVLKGFGRTRFWVARRPKANGD